MKGFKILLIAALTIGLSSTSLVAATSTIPPSKKCEWGCPFWEIEELEKILNRPSLQTNSFSTTSSMKENDKAYLISTDLPGIDKKEISIEISGNRLMISGERKEESEVKGSSRRSYQQFQQSYLLPNDANLEAISATSINGVLKITVPKIAGKKSSKKIEVK